MCGISGLVRTDGRPINTALLGKMTDLIAYRGPDGQGFLLGAPDRRIATYERSCELKDHQAFPPTIGLGHRRLSILDLSPAGRQPMASADGQLWIVFNGEVFNYVELADELRKLGHSFRTGTDTEVILAAYRQWGDKCVTRFNGMWAFAIWDVQRGRLFCSRDRYGIKPFYYRWADGEFAFASEVKQLVLEVQPRVNAEALYDALVIGMKDHLVETCFEGVVNLLGGHCLSLELAGGEPRVWRFYELCLDPRYADASLEEAVRAVHDTLNDAVRIRLRSDVPVGSCLSGGIDSSGIVGLMSRLRRQASSTEPQHTFTFVSSNPKWDESAYAVKVAQSAGVLHHLILPDPDEIRADIVKHIWHQDEPVPGLSPLAQWNVFKAARARGVPVMLDGQGGDELFLGYQWYYTAIIRSLLCSGRLVPAARMFFLAGLRSGSSHLRQVMQMAFFQISWARRMHVRSRASGWLRPDFIASQDLGQRLRPLRMPKELVPLQVHELTQACLPALLRYEDRNSMAFSVEARLPMLDYRLVELAISLPWEHKIREGWTKFVLRQAISDVVPAEVAWRKAKLGFTAPQREWMDLMRPDLEALLKGDLACSRLVDVDRLRAGLRKSELPDRILWRFFNLEHWMRLFNIRLS